MAIAAPAFAEPAATTSITLGLQNDSTLTVARVEAWPQGFVKATHPDGNVSYVPVSKVAWIRDSSGTDWTDHVLRKRGSVGEGSPKPAKTSGLTFQPRPLPFSKSFIVFNVGIGYEFVGDETNDKGVVTMDLGYMRNISRKSAVGASLSEISTEESSRLAIRGRYRYWLSPSVGLEGTVGPTIGVNDGYEGNNVGVVASVGVQALGWAGLRLEAERIRRNTYDYYYPYYAASANDVTQWRVVGDLGSGAGVVALCALTLLVIAAASSLD
ncbi:MAG: hypothetical protein ACRENN_01070 [Candidatus Eiseniibacteriota bacterium]